MQNNSTCDMVIGVVGFGIMGQGIVQVFATAGHTVIVKARNAESFHQRSSRLKRMISKSLSRQPIEGQTAESISDRMKLADSFAEFDKCDLVIEAVTEDEQVKQKIFGELCPHLSESAYLASNTSSFSITRLAGYTDRPDKFLGLHFMNPAPLMPLVEIIRGFATQEKTFNDIKSLVEGLGKDVVSPADSPGFILNRILIPMINEAIYALHEGAGSVQSIDKTLKGAANHPMGPLELADLIGLDTCLAIMNKLLSGMNDSKYRPCPLLVRYVEAGWLGRKTKRGFYDYSTSGRPATWPLPQIS